MYQEVCFNRGTEVRGGGGGLMRATRSAPPVILWLLRACTAMTWMIVWGQKSKHQKIPGPKIPPRQKKSHTELRGRNTRAPPRIFTYIKPPKIILAQFSYSKNSRNRKFQTQKNPSSIAVT